MKSKIVQRILDRIPPERSILTGWKFYLQQHITKPTKLFPKAIQEAIETWDWDKVTLLDLAKLQVIEEKEIVQVLPISEQELSLETIRLGQYIIGTHRTSSKVISGVVNLLSYGKIVLDSLTYNVQDYRFKDLAMETSNEK